MPIHAPRGTVDLLPEEAARTRHFEAVARKRFTTAGYGEIRSPLFEETALFSRSIGEDTDIVGKEMYTFTDRKGRSLTLRPEGTAGVVRAFVQHKLYAQPLPVKLYYIGPMFRYERPQAGRTRQFDQIGCEVLGSPAPGVDVEVAELAYRIFEDLGFTNLEVRLNSIGDPGDRPPYLEALRDYFESYQTELCGDCQSRLATNAMRILDCKVERDAELAADAPKPFAFISDACKTHHDTVLTLLDAAGLPHVHDDCLVRGLDYYTRTVFEIHHTGLGARSALCGGGRYDGLVEQLGGPATPACGFSIGVVPALLAAEREGLRLGGDVPVAAIILPLSEDAQTTAQRLLSALRSAGIPADADWSGRSVKAMLKRINKTGAQFAIIIGDDELAAAAVQIRDLSAGEQTSVPIADVVAYVTGQREQTT